MTIKYPKEKYATEIKFTLRLPKEYDTRINSELKKEIGIKSKNTWIIEAIHEKLKRK